MQVFQCSIFINKSTPFGDIAVDISPDPLSSTFCLYHTHPFTSLHPFPISPQLPLTLCSIFQLFSPITCSFLSYALSPCVFPFTFLPPSILSSLPAFIPCKNYLPFPFPSLSFISLPFPALHCLAPSLASSSFPSFTRLTRPLYIVCQTFTRLVLQIPQLSVPRWTILPPLRDALPLEPESSLHQKQEYCTQLLEPSK